MKRLLLGLILVFSGVLGAAAMHTQASVALCDWQELPEVIKGEGFDLVKFVPDQQSCQHFYDLTGPDVRKMLDFSDDMTIFNEEFNTYFAAKPLAYWIKDNSSGHFVGSVSIHQADCPYGQGDLCYWLCEAARRKGFASKAIEILNNYYFKSLPQKESYMAYVLEGNVGSSKVLQRVGFEQYCSGDYVLEEKTSTGTLRWLEFKLTRDEFFRRCGQAGSLNDQ